ncbi:MAG: SDR family oxidoreductase [Lysobacterales bacterium]
MSSAFAQKNVLISGGTSGINLGIAKVLAGAGANVAVFGRDPDKAATAAEAIDGCGSGQTLGLAADVRDFDAVDELVGRVSDSFGPLDVVIAGAAGNFPAPAIGIKPKGFKSVVDIDLLGTYHVFWAAFEKLRKPGASLVAITAPQAEQPMAFQAHVCAAKAGINMLVKCLALEWGAAGVRVNAVSPGPIDGTEGMARLAPTEALREQYLQATPLKRFGTPEDIGRFIAFLVSDGASYATGGIYPVDGGMQLGDATQDCLTLPKR